MILHVIVVANYNFLKDGSRTGKLELVSDRNMPIKQLKYNVTDIVSKDKIHICK